MFEIIGIMVVLAGCGAAVFGSVILIAVTIERNVQVKELFQRTNALSERCDLFATAIRDLQEANKND